MVDFGALPPEINSARMYAGPGSSSLQAAASAWNGLSAELQSAAQGYQTVITQLSSDGWTGPTSAHMASAVQPYVTWMQETAAQAEQAATQARTAAAAYEQAFTATVPPPLIAANRAETAAATQANVFGQYTPLIAQLEAQYGQMWAQDATAMYGYAGQSAAAAKVTPFASPAATTNPGGTATQAAAVSQATGTSAATGSQKVLSQLTSSMPNSLQSLATPAATAAPETLFQKLYGFIFGTTVLPTSLSAFVNSYAPYASFFYNTEGLPYFSIGMGNNFVQIAKTTGLLNAAAARRRRRQPGLQPAVWAVSAACWAGVAAVPLPCRAESPPTWVVPVRSASLRYPRRGSAEPRWRPRTRRYRSAVSALPRRAPAAATCSAVCRWPAQGPEVWAAALVPVTGSSRR